MKNRGPWVIYIKLLLTAFFWGGTFIAGRVIAQNVGPFSAAFLRFAIASSFLLLFTYRIENGLPRLKRKHIFPIILLGITGIFLYNVFFFKGLKEINAGRAALIVATNPIIIGLLSSLFFKEKLTPVKFLGIIISVLGAMVVISRGHLVGLTGDSFGWGEFYISCCVMCWVTYSLLGKAILMDLSPLVSVTYSSLVGTVLLLGPAFFEGMMVDLKTYSGLEWLGIFYLGFFGTAMGFVWFYEGIKSIGPTKSSQFINFVPISAVLLAFIILSEPITLSLAIGTALVCSGVYLTNTTYSNIDT